MQTARTTGSASAGAVAPVIVLAARRAEILRAASVPIVRVAPRPLRVRRLGRAIAMGAAALGVLLAWGAVSMLAVRYLRIAVPVVFALAAIVAWAITPPERDAEILRLRPERDD
ncbi:MAG: hypothetical protein HY775_11990 [Acidobacteria bacterium]|nr:hypothetical protein [Acidobacteriota bacterium]